MPKKWELPPNLENLDLTCNPLLMANNSQKWQAILNIIWTNIKIILVPFDNPNSLILMQILSEHFPLDSVKAEGNVDDFVAVKYFANFPAPHFLPLLMEEIMKKLLN